MTVAGNTYLRDIYLRLEGDLRRVYTLAFAADPDSSGSILSGEYHDSIQLHLTENDSEVSAAIARRFISKAHERVLRVLRSTPAAMGVALGQ